MNSIDKRLERLQSKLKPELPTYKYKRIEKQKKEYLEKQKGCCPCCGERFGHYNQPELDFPTKKYDYIVGLLCAKCKCVVDNCGRDIGVLSKAINYLSGGKKDRETFETAQQAIQDASHVQPSKMDYFDTNWSNIKPNE